MFQHFGQRLKRDLKQLVDRRLDGSALASGSLQKVSYLLYALYPVLTHFGTVIWRRS